MSDEHTRKRAAAKLRGLADAIESGEVVEFEVTVNIDRDMREKPEREWASREKPEYEWVGICERWTIRAHKAL